MASTHHDRAAALLLAGSLLAGCPSTEPTSVALEAAELVGNPASGNFVLHITGRGFASSALQYNLGSKAGTATSELRVEIFDKGDRGRTTVPRELLTVISSRELDARVVGTPLSPGSYGLRLFNGALEGPLASLEDAFVVVTGIEGDGGIGGEDSGQPPGDPGDADPSDAPEKLADAEPDAGGPDAETPDLGPPDSGVVPDSGLGPFVGAFQYRQQVEVTNASNATAPAGTTMRIPIPHQTLLTLGRAKPDATDFALYLSGAPVDYQWDDRAKIGTDELVMIARIPIGFPAGGLAEPNVLVLYYGDPAATVPGASGVLAFSEGFTNSVANIWNLRDWYYCNYDRASPGGAPAPGAYCVEDTATNPTRITLSTPTLPAIASALAPNQVYEVSLFLRGAMLSQTNDVVYFSYGPDVTTYSNTTLIPTANYVEFPPNAALTFTETTNAARSVEGWRLPAAGVGWTRVRGRFRPAISAPSLHLRFISVDATDNVATLVAVDDYAVRLALEPEFQVTLGSVEPR